MKRFAERLVRLRKEKNLTRQELSDKLGDYSKPTIAAWEADRRNPDADAILALSEFFGVETAYLAGCDIGGSAGETFLNIGTLYKTIGKDVKKLHPEDCPAVYDFIQTLLKSHPAVKPAEAEEDRSTHMGRTADTSGYTQAEIDLWEKLLANRNTLFHTAKGLEFRIDIRGNELFVSRKEKSITRASVNIAYRKWLADKTCGPKALGVFGSSYLWGVFKEINSD